MEGRRYKWTHPNIYAMLDHGAESTLTLMDRMMDKRQPGHKVTSLVDFMGFVSEKLVNICVGRTGYYRKFVFPFLPFYSCNFRSSFLLCDI